MPTITVLEKLYGSGSPETFETAYSSLCKGLKVKLGFAGTTDRCWVQIDVSGEDETVALRFLDREIGLAPISPEGITKFSVFRGKVVFSGKSKNELLVDLGIFSPEICDAVLPVSKLQGQLADGKEVSLQRLIELFCLFDNFPLEVKVVCNAEEQGKTFEARLSEAQVALFSNWVSYRFDRLIILGSSISDVKRTVKLSRYYRDIIRIESAGTLEQVILCKLGTDAVGLIPKLGHFLPDAVLLPFSPKKILEAVKSSSFH